MRQPAAILASALLANQVMACSHRNLTFKGSNQHATRASCVDCHKLRLLIHHNLPEHVIQEALGRRSDQLARSVVRTPTKTPRSASTPSTFRTPESAASSPRRRVVELAGSPSGQGSPPAAAAASAPSQPQVNLSLQMPLQVIGPLDRTPPEAFCPPARAQALCHFCQIKPSWNGERYEFCSTRCKTQAQDMWVEPLETRTSLGPSQGP
jgi:hypothetical protein